MPTPVEFHDPVIFFDTATFSTPIAVADSSIDNDSIDPDAAIATSKLATDTLQPEDIPLVNWIDSDSGQPLPATSSGTDLGRYIGTPGTDAPLIRSADLKAAGATTLRMQGQYSLPDRYVPGGNFRIRLFAGMVTTIAGTSCTIDVECWKITGATVGSDICQTAAMTMNSTTFGNKDFVINAAGLVAADSFVIRVTIACNDGASPTAVIAAIAKTQALRDIRG